MKCTKSEINEKETDFMNKYDVTMAVRLYSVCLHNLKEEEKKTEENKYKMTGEEMKYKRCK